MSWRQDLARIRDTDLARLGHHLKDLTLTSYDYSQLMSQYHGLKERYELLLAEKVVSEREYGEYMVRMEPAIGLARREREELQAEIAIRREDLESAEKTSKVLKDRAKMQCEQINQAMRDTNLLTSTKSILACQTKDRLSQLCQLRSHLSILSPHQSQLQQSLAHHKYLLQKISKDIDMLRNQEKANTKELEELERMNLGLRERVRGLLEKEGLDEKKVLEVKTQIHALLNRLREREEKVKLLRARISCLVEERGREIAQGVLLSKGISEAEDRLARKQALLNQVHLEVSAFEYQNKTTREQSARLAILIDNSNIEIDNLMECTSQLMRQIEYWLQEDGKVKAILNTKVDSYRNLLIKFGKTSSILESRSYKQELRSTTSSFASCIGRNI